MPALRDVTATPRPAYGYLIDHTFLSGRCCEFHNIHCDPPGDLCCGDCPEVDHGAPLGHRRCVLVKCGCRSERAHLDATAPGMSDRIGMRQQRPVDEGGVSR